MSSANYCLLYTSYRLYCKFVACQTWQNSLIAMYLYSHMFHKKFSKHLLLSRQYIKKFLGNIWGKYIHLQLSLNLSMFYSIISQAWGQKYIWISLRKKGYIGILLRVKVGRAIVLMDGTPFLYDCGRGRKEDMTESLASQSGRYLFYLQLVHMCFNYMGKLFRKFFLCQFSQNSEESYRICNYSLSICWPFKFLVLNDCINISLEFVSKFKINKFWLHHMLKNSKNNDPAKAGKKNRLIKG